MTDKAKIPRRDLNGVLLLDKPVGISSNHALQQAKRLFLAKKAGHTGTLDPLASGLLMICFGKATKLSQYLLNSDKAYEVTAKFGVTTTTGDGEGEIVSEKPVSGLDCNMIESVLPSFQGDILQVPSKYSALKVDGKPMYEWTRKGIEIERSARPISIYQINLNELSGTAGKFYVHCSKGTYIRTLVEDIGSALGCGAYVTELRRTLIGQFKIEDSVSLDLLHQLKREDPGALDQLLLPLEQVVSSWPAITVNDVVAVALSHGRKVDINKDSMQGLVRVMRRNGQVLGLCEIAQNTLIPRQVFNQAGNA